MRIEAEYCLSHKRRRSLQDLSYAGVAIFEGAREIAHLEGRTHHVMLRVRHLTTINECLCATADPGVERADQDLSLLPEREVRRHDLAVPG
jgi:hypothetical protein